MWSVKHPSNLGHRQLPFSLARSQLSIMCSLKLNHINAFFDCEGYENMILGFAKVENTYLYTLGPHFIYTSRKKLNISFPWNPFYNKMFFSCYMYLKGNLKIIDINCNFFLMISDCISFLQKNFHDWNQIFVVLSCQMSSWFSNHVMPFQNFCEDFPNYLELPYKTISCNICKQATIPEKWIYL